MLILIENRVIFILVFKSLYVNDASEMCLKMLPITSGGKTILFFVRRHVESYSIA